jgi:hypothetical protein
VAATALDRIREISDARERARQAHALLGELQSESAEASRIRQQAVTELITRNGASRIEVADLLGVSRERVRQILAEGPPPELALLAPGPGPVTICVVQKREAERGRPAITMTTAAAVRELAGLAASYDIETEEDAVPVSGMIDLNRPNLVVLIGPRSSPLIAQAVTADPAVRWHPDKNGDWFITDAKTGEEYHSDFDSGADPGGWPRTCYAHVGRVRRPDGQGSWLCLAGEHAPGVAGAASLFVRDITALWEQVPDRRSLWSAIAKVTVGEDGAPLGAALITPVYIHGRG